MHLKILIAFLILFPLGLNSQDKSLTENLKEEYLTEDLSLEKRLDILGKLAQHSPDPSDGLKYSNKLIKLAKRNNAVESEIQGFLQKGNSLKLLGELSRALEAYLEALDLAQFVNNIQALGAINIALADLYSVMDNKTNTIAYYRKAINILEPTELKELYASALLNLGDEYNLTFSQPDSALYYFEKSDKLFSELDNKLGKAYTLGNKGLAYAQLGYSERAESNIKEAIELLDSLGAYSAISEYLTHYSELFNAKGKVETAKEFAQTSLDLATKYGLKDQISDANLKLSELAEGSGNIDEALKYYKRHITYKDSVRNLSVFQELAKQRMDFEVRKQEKDKELLSVEAQKQKTLTIGVAIALFLSALLAFGLYRRTLFISKTKKIIEAERYRSDKLLLNILPGKIAHELKSSGKVKARKFESVSVLFTDFKGFTNYAEKLSPEELVKSIGFYFSEFDKIIERYELEKIKTIGDSYMCASGLPISNEDHAIRISNAALDILDFVESVKNDDTKDFANFEIRIGIHSGSVVAGVVGSKKFVYDIWGDTVNVASRMESMSQVGKINVSQNTFNLIKDKFICHYRGEYKVKNHGDLKMYFLENTVDK